MSTARRPLVLLLAVPALAVGCSATPAPTPSTSSPPAITANPTPVSTEATSAPATSPAASTSCPAGEYRATAFTASGLGKVTVREVDAEFRNGRYTFDFDDDQPVTLTVGKRTEKVRVDGEIRGTYSGDADALTFALGTTTGTARVQQKGTTRSFPMRDVAAVLAPQGKGSALCTGDNLTLKSARVTWNLVRDDD